MIPKKQVDAQFPRKLSLLFKPSRYKVLHGGRGSGKSWGVARALLILAAQKPMRVLCTREVQNSILESVHKLLSDQVESLGLSNFYEIQKTTIKGANGSQFIFEGLRHNINSIKSMEGVDVCWVEEAEKVTDESWRILIPTIRAPSSEIWVTFNPHLETDPTYQRFIANPPPDCLSNAVNWRDNPWFPVELENERRHAEESGSKDLYLHTWEGHCLRVLDGAVYADEMRKMREEGRIGRVPYEPSKPVYTFWDLGFGDNTAIWFVQSVGMQVRVIDYYSANRQPLTHYVQMLQSRGYVYAEHGLPHDARHANLGTGKTVQEMLEELGLKIRIVPQVGIDNGIQAVRRIMPNVWIDDKCADGIRCLEYYHYETNKDGGAHAKPAHDWSSHGADAFRYFAVGFEEKTATPLKIKPPRSRNAWMG